jgi:hypothetical protein
MALRSQEYYDRLQRVRTHGDWEGWPRFLLNGVVETAEEALMATRRILYFHRRARCRSRWVVHAVRPATAVITESGPPPTSGALGLWKRAHDASLTDAAASDTEDYGTELQ